MCAVARPVAQPDSAEVEPDDLSKNKYFRMFAVLCPSLAKHGRRARVRTAEAHGLQLMVRREGDLLGHYDDRFYHGIVSDAERTESQIHLIRAYLGFFREHGLDTWIAHGTLLGWWWNGKVGAPPRPSGR